MVSRLRPLLTGEAPRPDWVEELPVEYGRAGEPIYTRVNATHQDRVLRVWTPTVVKQWGDTPYRKLQAEPKRRKRRAA